MAQLPPNTVNTVSIDSTGEIATFHLSDTDEPAHTIGLNLDGDEAASYAVDLGAQDSGESTTWFTDEVTYDSVSQIRDGWVQAEERLRIRVTTAASAGSEATLYLARGD